MSKQQPGVDPGQLANRALLPYIHKQVDFSYHGCRLRFYLSRALFSSFQVDDGTRLLLKTLAKLVDFDQFTSVLDLGCGAGIIGLSLLKKHPHLQVHCVDRDALALAFTRENAYLNGLEGIRCSGQLGLEDTSALYDLVVSNIPAKAGAPVIEDILRRCLRTIAADGLCAVVVISSLAGQVAQLLRSLPVEVRLEEATPRYTVFHFAGLPGSAEVDVAPDFFQPYIRGRVKHNLEGNFCLAETVYNLPDFDTLGFQARAVLKLLQSYPLSGSCLFWNPGQGHVSLYAFFKNTQEPDRHFTLGGRDLLPLYITRRNLHNAGLAAGRLALCHCPLMQDLTGGPYRYVVLEPDIIPGVPWEKVLWQAAASLLTDGGRVIISLKNSYQHRLLSAAAGFRLIKKTRHKTCSAMLLEKKAAVTHP